MIQDGVATFEPAVGMGVTILMWTDRKAATIVEVDRFKSGPKKGQVKTVVIVRDIVTRVDNNGMSDSQTYTYEPDPNGYREHWTIRKDGRFRQSGYVDGNTLRIGSRDYYHDYSF